MANRPNFLVIAADGCDGTEIKTLNTEELATAWLTSTRSQHAAQPSRCLSQTDNHTACVMSPTLERLAQVTRAT
ncbi:hypothetical protein FA95DRAFT_1265384 [Auriscalpium vulgare]|uniref:Uncharacterized protein n=1 Tax=Auriscalpium vulgare TaxID=40419 RepID=A0ACB8RSM9_9AGAM|nr:hypothetical protein FA95DRAFT_1265384 [Auriscalpium vulgare]